RRARRDDHRRGRGGHHPPGPASLPRRLLHARMPPRWGRRARSLRDARRLPGGQGGEVPGGAAVSVTMPCPACWGSQLLCDYCDGRGQIEDVQLSPHFRLPELLRSDTAQTQGLYQVPTPAVVERLRDLCVELLEPVRAEVGPLRVTSGYRRPRVNSAVGGSSTSAHMHGWAADVVPVRGTPEQIMLLLHDAAQVLAWDQAILYDGRVHLGLRRPATGEQRMQLLRSDGVA